MDIAEAIHVLAVARLTREQRAAVKVLGTYAKKKGDLAGLLLLKLNEAETRLAEMHRAVPLLATEEHPEAPATGGTSDGI